MPPRRERNEAVLKARALRRDMTLPEGLLWRELRQRPGGFKFRRQHPIGSYVLDFYCPASKLVVEVDGAAHSMGGGPERDARRDLWLGERDLRVVRFAAADVINDLPSVIAEIVGNCRR